MKLACLTLILSLLVYGTFQASCKYGGRGSLTTTCTDATSAYLKSTTYRFDHLDETVLCINCTLTVIESNNFDFYYNQIKVLDLTDCHITLLKPKAFIGLIYLVKLTLRSNQITTVPPLTFAGINRVQHLDLQDNKITALVADGFKELRNLETLILANNNVNVLENGTFNGLVSLEVLDLTRNRITSVSQAFNGLVSLANLDLQGNQVATVEPGEFAVETLIRLNLAGNRIKSLLGDGFLPFAKLETLNVSSNPVETIFFNSFRGLGAVEDFDLHNASLRAIPKAALAPLRNCRNLDLSLNRLAIFKTGMFAGLPELRKLNLSGNRIVEYAKTGVFPLVKMHTLDLSNNVLIDLDYKTFVKTMPTLAYLEMSGNPWRCSIAAEMQDEFRHDNFIFNLGIANNTECNDTGPVTSLTGEIEPETLTMGDLDGHQYVLYVFIVISLGLTGYMFYVQLKHRKEISHLIGMSRVGEERLIEPDDDTKEEL